MVPGTSKLKVVDLAKAPVTPQLMAVSPPTRAELEMETTPVPEVPLPPTPRTA
eukprot:CAMPEP_0182898788 /NCGR_PEP_ID=MMETSP0034_2-20130328/27695_1 /TAXON_ID=156128 /ORGANISM="Nephroselmis pyriformis, Strain CCMP717" /LENGTH=52 /DNA_ID=CAMNT_0025032777 /DNA_START=9 /DNA_END=164 /DNA_ORIENTATION=+